VVPEKAPISPTRDYPDVAGRTCLHAQGFLFIVFAL
jgi:hypothetical protein